MVLKGRPNIFLYCCLFISLNIFSQAESPDLGKDKSGGIVYEPDQRGNKIPDFSYSGYKLSSEKIPTVPAKVIIPPAEGDATKRIQQAINYVSGLKPDKNGFRGAVVLEAGIFDIEGTIYLNKSGVVLRGSGNLDKGTVLLGKGVRREAMIRILGKEDYQITDTLQLEEKYIPLGARSITINSETLESGDRIFIQKKLEQDWLDSLQVKDFGGEAGWIGWKTRDWDINWDREVVQYSPGKAVLNAPLTMSLDPKEDSLYVLKYEWPGRIEQSGVENLKIKSDYNQNNPKDEQHRWLGISIENARNIWVRRVNFQNLAGGAVHVIKTGSQVTVEDCISEHPVSEIAAFRRHTFYTEGQQTLFQRCYSEYGYHDFAVGGYGTTGPNAFVQCEAYMPYSFSGAIGSWATGILFDVVNIDGEALSLGNQGQSLRGAGWTAANSVIWESSASKMEVPNPPTAQNWAFGVWGQYAGNGHWKEVNSHISPRSLFYAQLKKRFQELPIDPDILEIGTEPSTSPTLEAAEELTREAENELIVLKEWIRTVDERRPLELNSEKALSYKKLESRLPEERTPKTGNSVVVLKNGILTFENKIIAGKHMNVMWWRGSLRDEDIRRASPHITRFAPGRRGKGLTDNLEETVSYLEENNIVSLNHNYGLWYDRRMDDHQRVRRYDADTWPPFYEQPFDRSGEGLAWDHLSKYDLTKYNTWYWSRLQRFAELAEQKGKILFHQQYFQHNILEAGAHWSSSPWRSANNINETGFSEPPPYAGDKRIFLARQFYDINNEKRRGLHQSYIRKSLDNFKNETNVVQFTSEEYTGPLHFMQFWVDEIRKWEAENSNQALIGLSATKDVQDAILADEDRANTIDVIDIKYWYYRENGETYAPEGGKNLAPRQHARKMETGKESSSSVYRAIREYRERFPKKAVFYTTNAAPRFGWAQLMATASLPVIPKVSLESFYSEIPQMTFEKTENYKSDKWTLQNEGKAYLFYINQPVNFTVDLSDYKGKYQLYTIDPENGTASKKEVFKGGEIVNIQPDNSEKIFFIEKL